MTEPIKLDILYGIDQETQRVHDTVKNLSWYSEQGYPDGFVKLPADIDKDSNDEEIKKVVSQEYLEDEYANCAKEIKEKWGNASKNFEEMQKICAFHLASEYHVVLTRYGSGGSYNADRKLIIIRFGLGSCDLLMRTIVHEIIHTTIQYLIDKYQVKHWRKERLVDLLLKHYSPELARMQGIKEDVSAVDQIFEESFPDIETVVWKIGNIQ